MPDNKPSWIDYLNLGLTVVIGGIGTYIAVHIGESADRLSQNGLIVATATFLLDDSPTRRQGGVQIVSWLQENKVVVPPWEEHLFVQIASQSDTEAPTKVAQVGAVTPAPPLSSPNVPPAPPVSAAPGPGTSVSTAPSGQSVANQLFAVLGGTTPRLFIEISDSEQRQSAEGLRSAMDQVPLNGQLVVVPKIENVKTSPNQVQLRFLKRADRDEANVLAATLGRLLGTAVPVRDLSQNFETRSDVKPRTYELWFPHGHVISLVADRL